MLIKSYSYFHYETIRFKVQIFIKINNPSSDQNSRWTPRSNFSRPLSKMVFKLEKVWSAETQIVAESQYNELSPLRESGGVENEGKIFWSILKRPSHNNFSFGSGLLDHLKYFQSIISKRKLVARKWLS